MPADHAAPVTAIVKPLARVDRVAVHRSTSFKPHYPVGGPQAHVWNRALARSDEVRRVPGVDPRSVGPYGVDPRIEPHINHRSDQYAWTDCIKLSSSPRKRGSILQRSKGQWIPAFAGMTNVGVAGS